MAVSYDTGAVYVVNAGPNSRMPETGIYWTADQGMTWRRANAQGLQGRILALAVHPKKSQVLVVGTDRGLFFSRDHGDRFERAGGAAPVTAAGFDLTGERVWFAAVGDNSVLARIGANGSSVTHLSLPSLDPRDAVAYIAQNPAHRGQWAIATFGRDVYLTPDAGRTWRRLAAGGNTL